MPGRPKINAAAPLRSSVADVAFAVEERVVWRAVDLLRGAADVARWPFERLLWALERSLVWPLEDRADGWGVPARTAWATGLALFAAAAGVLGLVLAAGSGSTAPVREASAPVATPAPVTAKAPPAPVLHGPAPDFTPEAGDAAGQASSGEAAAPVSESSTGAAQTLAAGTPKAVDPGKEAIDVARRFSGAFVLYETGKTNGRVRSTIEATATPQVTRDLLRRPPRLPANVTVPKAKVLNVVPGPKHGDVYTVSVSLLRVGVTSELRLGVQREESSGEWQVTETLG